MAGTNLSAKTTSTLNIITTDDDTFALSASCFGTPPTTSGVFQHSCIMYQLNGTAGLPSLYQNVGTVSVPVWSLIETASTQTDVPFLNATSFVRVTDITTVFDLYVNAATGDDSNDGTSPLTPFLTIQKAINTLAASIHGSNAIIHIANGTYNENLVAKDMLGGAGDLSYGSSVITLLGNTATPNSVIVVGTNANAGTFFSKNNRTNYILDGMSVRSNSNAASAAIYNENSFVVLRDINSSLCGSFLISKGGKTRIENTAQGGVHSNLTSGIILKAGAYCFLDKSLTFTNLSLYGFDVTQNSFLDEGNNSRVYSFAPAVIMVAGVHVTDHSVVTGFGGTTFSTLTAVLAAIHLNTGGKFISNGSGTYNITDSSFKAFIEGCSVFIEQVASSWNALGTTLNSVTLEVGSVALNVNGFSSATFVFTESFTTYKYGYDIRYTHEVTGQQSGALVTGLTNYFSFSGLQSTYIPLYVAQQDESVDRLEIASRVGNGVGHSDVYTVVKNGVDTTMTKTIANASSGSTTVNPVTLAAGDTIGIKVVTDAATAANDVIALMIVRKT